MIRRLAEALCGNGNGGGLVDQKGGVTMTRISLITVLLIVVLGCWTAVTTQALAAQQVNFSLALGQWVTLGSYAMQFKGFIGSFPSYDLYFGTSLLAQFPSNPPSPNAGKYVYQNVSIATTGASSDGSVETGTLTVQ